MSGSAEGATDGSYRRPRRQPKRDSRAVGLQAERTLLAWHRTLIGLVAVTLIYLREPLLPGGAQTDGGILDRLVPVLGVAAALGALVVHLRRRWRTTQHGLHDDRTGRPPAPVARPWALMLVSAACALLAIAAAASALPG